MRTSHGLHRRDADSARACVPVTGQERETAPAPGPPLTGSHLYSADARDRPSQRHRDAAKPRRCAGPWPRPKSVTTSSATTRPSSRSRSRAAELLGKEAGLFVPSGYDGQSRGTARAPRPWPGDDRRQATTTSPATRPRAMPSSSARASAPSTTSPTARSTSRTSRRPSATRPTRTSRSRASSRSRTRTRTRWASR